MNVLRDRMQKKDLGPESPMKIAPDRETSTVLGISDQSFDLATRVIRALKKEDGLYLLGGIAGDSVAPKLVYDLAAAVTFTLQKSTLLINGDLRSHSMHDPYTDEVAPGFVELLRGEAELSTMVRKSDFPNLSLLPCGVGVDAPVPLLLSGKLEHVLDTARKAYDLVFVSVPPVPDYVDATIVARLADGVIVCVSAEKHTRTQVANATRVFKETSAPVLGAILCTS